MVTIGVFEAKTKLSEILERVAAGEEFLITRHGHPLARLIPAARRSADEIAGVVDEFEKLQGEAMLNPPGVERLTIDALRDRGRR